LADAVAGAVYNAITRTPKQNTGEVDIVTRDDVRLHLKGVGDEVNKKPQMPKDIADYLTSMGAL